VQRLLRLLSNGPTGLRAWSSAVVQPTRDCTQLVQGHAYQASPAPAMLAVGVLAGLGSSTGFRGSSAAKKHRPHPSFVQCTAQGGVVCGAKLAMGGVAALAASTACFMIVPNSQRTSAVASSTSCQAEPFPAMLCWWLGLVRRVAAVLHHDVPCHRLLLHHDMPGH
jgi:hypothetical protein